MDSSQPRKRPRVFWIGIAASPQLAALAKLVDDATAGLGVCKGGTRVEPALHIGARRGSGAPQLRQGDRPNPVFQRLQEKLAAMRALQFGTMTAREFFLYQSQPMQGGARYTEITAHFGLGLAPGCVLLCGRGRLARGLPMDRR